MLGLRVSLRLSLIEPGPVRTDFEMKMFQGVKERECPGADAETVHYFKELYVPSAMNMFSAVGQTPEEISRVSSHVSASLPTHPPPSLIIAFVPPLSRRSASRR